jgi:pimeloyl-ACP methyl ester carboxylesterase
MRTSDRVAFELGARNPALARRVFRRWQDGFRGDPDRFLKRFIAKLVPADRALFRGEALSSLFMQDLRQVFIDGDGPESLANELVVFRAFRVDPARLPADRRVMVWHGLDDDLVPPSMAYAFARRLPNCEAHLVPGGHFVAIEVADQVLRRLQEVLEETDFVA